MYSPSRHRPTTSSDIPSEAPPPYSNSTQRLHISVQLSGPDVLRWKSPSAVFEPRFQSYPQASTGLPQNDVDRDPVAWKTMTRSWKGLLFHYQAEEIIWWERAFVAVVQDYVAKALEESFGDSGSGSGSADLHKRGLRLTAFIRDIGSATFQIEAHRLVRYMVNWFNESAPAKLRWLSGPHGAYANVYNFLSTLDHFVPSGDSACACTIKLSPTYQHPAKVLVKGVVCWHPPTPSFTNLQSSVVEGTDLIISPRFNGLLFDEASGSLTVQVRHHIGSDEIQFTWDRDLQAYRARVPTAAQRQPWLGSWSIKDTGPVHHVTIVDLTTVAVVSFPEKVHFERTMRGQISIELVPRELAAPQNARELPATPGPSRVTVGQPRSPPEFGPSLNRGVNPFSSPTLRPCRSTPVLRPPKPWQSEGKGRGKNDGFQHEALREVSSNGQHVARSSTAALDNSPQSEDDSLSTLPDYWSPLDTPDHLLPVSIRSELQDFAQTTYPELSASYTKADQQRQRQRSKLFTATAPEMILVPRPVTVHMLRENIHPCQSDQRSRTPTVIRYTKPDSLEDITSHGFGVDLDLPIEQVVPQICSPEPGRQAVPKIGPLLKLRRELQASNPTTSPATPLITSRLGMPPREPKSLPSADRWNRYNHETFGPEACASHDRGKRHLQIQAIGNDQGVAASAVPSKRLADYSDESPTKMLRRNRGTRDLRSPATATAHQIYKVGLADRSPRMSHDKTLAPRSSPPFPALSDSPITLSPIEEHLDDEFCRHFPSAEELVGPSRRRVIGRNPFRTDSCSSAHRSGSESDAPLEMPRTRQAGRSSASVASSPSDKENNGNAPRGFASNNPFATRNRRLETSTGSPSHGTAQNLFRDTFREDPTDELDLGPLEPFQSQELESTDPVIRPSFDRGSPRRPLGELKLWAPQKGWLSSPAARSTLSAQRSSQEDQSGALEHGSFALPVGQRKPLVVSTKDHDALMDIYEAEESVEELSNLIASDVDAEMRRYENFSPYSVSHLQHASPSVPTPGAGHLPEEMTPFNAQSQIQKNFEELLRAKGDGDGDRRMASCGYMESDNDDEHHRIEQAFLEIDNWSEEESSCG